MRARASSLPPARCFCSRASPPMAGRQSAVPPGRRGLRSNPRPPWCLPFRSPVVGGRPARRPCVSRHPRRGRKLLRQVDVALALFELPGAVLAHEHVDVAPQHRERRRARRTRVDHAPHDRRVRPVAVEGDRRIRHEVVVGARHGPHDPLHERLDLGAPLRPTERPEQHLTGLGEERGVRVEVVRVEVAAVVDEQLLDLQEVFEPSNPRLDVVAHPSSSRVAPQTTERYTCRCMGSETTHEPNQQTTQWALADVFDVVSDAVPDRTALVWRDRRQTYGETRARSDAVAAFLAARRVRHRAGHGRHAALGVPAGTGRAAAPQPAGARRGAARLLAGTRRALQRQLPLHRARSGRPAPRDGRSGGDLRARLRGQASRRRADCSSSASRSTTARGGRRFPARSGSRPRSRPVSRAPTFRARASRLRVPTTATWPARAGRRAGRRACSGARATSSSPR